LLKKQSPRASICSLAATDEAGRAIGKFQGDSDNAGDVGLGACSQDIQRPNTGGPPDPNSVTTFTLSLRPTGELLVGQSGQWDGR